jgi:hypothetical protein
MPTLKDYKNQLVNLISLDVNANLAGLKNKKACIICMLLSAQTPEADIGN